MTGNAYIANLAEPGKLGVTFNSIFNTGSSNFTNYIVVDTDYTSYSLVYSCSTRFFGLLKNEVAWILSRARTLNQTSVDKIMTKLTTISPKLVSNLKISDQSNRSLVHSLTNSLVHVNNSLILLLFFI